LTLKQLFWMARGRRVEQWNHTSQLLAMLHNVNCTRRTDLAEPWQFHPYGKRPKLPKGSIHDLKALIKPKRGK
jgi:hypothetical protein